MHLQKTLHHHSVKEPKNLSEEKHEAFVEEQHMVSFRGSSDTPWRKFLAHVMYFEESQIGGA